MKKRCSLAVLTCARQTDDPWEYLKRTIAGIEAQGAPVVYRVLVVDGQYDGPRFGGWDIVQFRGKLPGSGNRDAWWRMFQAANDVGGDWVMLEDDVEIVPGGLSRMLGFDLSGDIGICQFFSSKAIISDQRPRLHRAPLGSIRFLQASKFSRDAIAKLVAFKNHENYVLKPNSADQTLGNACKLYGIRHGIHVPALVQHVGVRSKNTPSAGLPWWRTAEVLSTKMVIKDLDLYDYT